jgi:Na+-translocating ferredoxin:NAD+ oxidoreductase RnfE subunit
MSRGSIRGGELHSNSIKRSNEMLLQGLLGLCPLLVVVVTMAVSPLSVLARFL